MLRSIQDILGSFPRKKVNKNRKKNRFNFCLFNNIEQICTNIIYNNICRVQNKKKI